MSLSCKHKARATWLAGMMMMMMIKHVPRALSVLHGPGSSICMCQRSTAAQEFKFFIVVHGIHQSGTGSVKLRKETLHV
jgi:hypothetical protein